MVFGSVQVSQGVQLCSAQVLPVIWNQLNDTEKVILSDGFFAAPSCKHDKTYQLDLSGSYLASIPDLGLYKNLRKLDLSGNLLTHMPKVHQLAHLKSINFPITC